MSELVDRLRSRFCCDATTCRCDEVADVIESLEQRLVLSERQAIGLSVALRDCQARLAEMDRLLREAHS